MRTHISLPRELIEEIDDIAGPRKRSDFIEGAIKLKLLNERQKRALEKYKSSGGLKGDYPEWSTPEAVSEWVHNLRREDDQRRQQRLRKPAD